jgi:dihydrofolate reductase
LTVSLIVAMAADGLIGNESGLPWHLPRDLKRFRRLTLGKPIVMGRTTFEAIGRPLDRRLNIVLTHRADYHATGCRVAHSPAECLAIAREDLDRSGQDEAMVIGGGVVFREFLPDAETVYLTLVEGHFSGHTFFPAPLLGSPEWEATHEESWPADEANPHPHRFLVLRRKAAGRPGRVSIDRAGPDS